MKYFLSFYGDVLPFKKYEFLKIFFTIRKNDYIFFNWLENLIIRNGRFNVIGFSKAFLILTIFRLSLGRVVFVKHNNYPHDCCKDDIEKAKKAIRFFEKLANIVIVHSLPDTYGNNVYVPHPLYKNISNSTLINKNNDTYVIFGRILPYKKIENVIEIFPVNKKLIIAGSCTDKEYLQKLKSISYLKENIEIIPKFLEENEIKSLVEESAGILITHNDDDMIVSGSFFYAMTLKSRVYALETPFFKWVEEQIGNEYVTTFSDLCDLEYAINRNISQKSVNGLSMIDLFGEKSIHNSLSSLFNGANS